MKVLILQKSGIEESLVICELAGVLKAESLEVFLFIFDYEKNIFSQMKRLSPDIVALQAEIGHEKWLSKISEEIRRELPRAIIVSFGSIPTFYQRNIGFHSDFVIVGEPEIPFLSLIKYVRGKSAELINVIHMREFDADVRFQPLEFDLDSLPMPYREIYYNRYGFLRDFPVKRFLMSRGCVLSCSFCYISALRSLLGKTKVRFKSPQRIAEEVIKVKERYPLKFVHFSDDLFPVWNRGWLESFSDIWRREVKLPFSVITLANFINDRISEILKETGCRVVMIGIETYNEKKRLQELGKTSVTNSVIYSAVSSLKKYGIRVISFNIVGLMGEDEEDWFKTAEFNRSLGVDVALASIFTPIPGTQLGDKFISDSRVVSNGAYYFRDVFSLISRSEVAQKIFKLSLSNDLLKYIFSKIGDIYFAFLLKDIYGVTFLEGLNFYLKVGSLKKRRANLHQVG